MLQAMRRNTEQGILTKKNKNSMGLIRNARELEMPKTMTIMIYGQAGCGKTTLALGAEKPLLLDFDGGVRRVRTEHLADVGTVQVQRWQDVIDVLSDSESISGFSTIVVDTVGKMIDFIQDYECNGRQPRIQDWGRINKDVKWFCQELSKMGKDVIFIAHRTMEKRGEDMVFIPNVRSKNYNDIVTDLDLLGYMEMRSVQGVQTRSITFDPTSENDGKNTCGLPSVIRIPVAGAKNTFLRDSVIKAFRDVYREKEKAVKEYAAEVEEMERTVAQITDAEGANKFCAALKGQSYGNDLLVRVRDMLRMRVAELGLRYDKETKVYSA